MNTKNAPYNIEKDGGEEFNYDTLSVELIEYGKKTLQNMGFKFPDYTFYSSRIKKVYGWDIDNYSNKIIALRPDMFPEIVLKEHKYILIQNSDSDNEFYIDTTNLYHYNNYIFYNNRLAFGLLKLKNPNLLKDLVQEYGYSEDKELLEWIFTNSKKDNVVDVTDMYFENIFLGASTEKKLRKDIVNYYLQLYPISIRYFSPYVMKIIESKEEDYIKDYDGNRNEAVAFLLEKILEYVKREGEVVNFFVEEILQNYPSFLQDIEKNNCYNYPLLQHYLKEVYPTLLEEQEASKVYVIEDPDGYTNLRKRGDSESEVLEKIPSGEVIEILSSTGVWWFVRTQRGNVGYVHKSRIKQQTEYESSTSSSPYTSPAEKPTLRSGSFLLDFSNEPVYQIYKGKSYTKNEWYLFVQSLPWWQRIFFIS